MIPGLDVNKGLAHFGGNAATFIDVLRSYAVNTPSILERLRGATPDTLADYAIAVHGLAGTSMGIFAAEVGGQAKVLEKAAKEGDFDFVSANTPALLEAAARLVADIRELLAKLATENPRPRKGEPDRDLLKQLLAACENFNVDGIDAAMAELESCEYESGGELVSWLRANVDRADYAQIEERLSTLIGEKDT